MSNEFPISQYQRLKFQTDWLVYYKHIEGASCKTCVLCSNAFAGKGSHQKLGALYLLQNGKTQSNVLTNIQIVNIINYPLCGPTIL